MLGLRVRLTPRWLIRRHPAWVVAVTAAAVVIALLALPGTPAGTVPPDRPVRVMPVAFTATALLIPAGTVLWIIAACTVTAATTATALWITRRRRGGL